MIHRNHQEIHIHSDEAVPPTRYPSNRTGLTQARSGSVLVPSTEPHAPTLKNCPEVWHTHAGPAFSFCRHCTVHVGRCCSVYGCQTQQGKHTWAIFNDSAWIRKNNSKGAVFTRMDLPLLEESWASGHRSVGLCGACKPQFLVCFDIEKNGKKLKKMCATRKMMKVPVDLGEKMSTYLSKFSSATTGYSLAHWPSCVGQPA